MKDIKDLNLAADRYYSPEHTWALKDDGLYKVGISDFAQDQLGELIFVELPEVGDTFSAGDEFGSVESVKAVSELYSPISGEIVEINETLEEEPELVSNAPYDRGWMIKIRPNTPSEVDGLLNAEQYLSTLSDT
jgi:glycine cleavage system H protein